MKIHALVLATALLNFSCTKHSALDDCRKNTSKCSTVDIDDAEAKASYKTGCDAKDADSCYRLGQYAEVKDENMGDALNAYEASCTLKNSDGCEDAKDLRSKLCYLDKKTDYCKGEPEGEYKIYVFLDKLDPKLQDAFLEHDFSSGFANDGIEDIYNSRLEEKNKKVLAALKLAKEKGHHDGADAENLDHDILVLEGKAVDGDNN